MSHRSDGESYIGKSVARNEDGRLLSGQALFVDDVHLPRLAHVAFYRSDHAHALIRRIDTARAKSRAGVIAVYTAADLGALWQPGPLLVPPPPIEGLVFNQATPVPLARDKLTHVGEPVVMVVAESRYIAEDALEEIDIEVEVLPAVVDMERALDADAPIIHPSLGTNLATHAIQRKGDYASVRESAAHIVARRFSYDRGVSGPIENRGVVAQWDASSQELTVWDTTQAPIPIRNGLAALLGLRESQVRVIAPFVGGGFGPKIMMFYPEEVLLPWAAMALGRPLKWIEDRRESFFATTQERGQVHEAELALDAKGHILGLRDSFTHDTGAYNSYGLTVPINSQCTALGPYAIDHYESEFRVAFTNKPLVTPIRGAGRQHGVFVIERLLDIAARELAIDPVQLRERNLLPADAFPVDHQILYQDFAPLYFDSGNYAETLAKALDMIGYGEFTAVEQPRARASGRCLGIGVVAYIEGTGVGPYEGARVTIEPSGHVRLATGVGTQGQGHFTTFAQLVCESLGVDVSHVHVVTGDTREFHWGTGTFASRGAVVAGNACHAAAMRVREKVIEHAAEALEAAPVDIVLADGRAHVRGARDVGISLGELAVRANPLRGAVVPGTEPGLEATAYFGPDRGNTANGVHAMIVEVDPDTAMVSIVRYVVVHDCGVVINPMIVEGQIHGGVGFGIGNAFYEALQFDQQGQVLNANFMEYLLPTAPVVPSIEVGHTEAPSPLNPLGVKGVGEAGAIPGGALFAQAVENALEPVAPGLEILDIPLDPSRLFALIEAER